MICCLLATCCGCYGQHFQVRQKGYVLYEDSTQVAGWIAGLADSSHYPRLVVLYPDSASSMGRPIFAKGCVKIALSNGRRYMAAFYGEPVLITGKVADLNKTRQFHFLPLIVEGKYNLVKAMHNDHIDLHLITRSGSSLTNWPLQVSHLDSQGVQQSFEGKRRGYLGQLWLTEHFSHAWAEKLARQLSDTTVPIAQWVAGLNTAIHEHSQEERRLRQAGVDRFRLSLSAGQFFAYNRLVFPDIADDGIKAPVHGAHLGADVVLQSGDSTALRLYTEIGYRQHHFHGFYFNTLRFHAGTSMQWYWRKHTDLFAGVVFGHYICDWSGALSRQFEEHAIFWRSQPDRHYTACAIRAGIFTKPSNWQIALSYSAISAIENDKLYFSLHHFGLHLSKHVDFYLDTFKRRRK